MYKFKKENQISFTDFDQPLGLKMNPDNRWVKKAEMIPWETIEAEYAKLFPSLTGMPAKPLRIDSILEQVRSNNANMIILSDELGWGVRPRDEKSRLIQTVIGNLNRYTAQIADEVNIVECGIARRIK